LETRGKKEKKPTKLSMLVRTREGKKITIVGQKLRKGEGRGKDGEGTTKKSDQYGKS